MGYVRKAYRNIFEQLDNSSDFPNGWNEFVEKHARYQNLVIKSNKGKCHCTNCNYDFVSKKKVNEYVKCPNCKNTYLVKRSNLRYQDFKDYLSILDCIDNTFVIRYFELKTIIGADHISRYSIVEFAREFPTGNYYRDMYVNDRVSKCQCHIYISHYDRYFTDNTKWRQYTRNYSLIDYSIVFPNNLKNLLNNTKLKYSCIWDIAKHSTYMDLSEILNVNDDNSLKIIELLAKMKLYNLALSWNKFSSSGSFQTIFGLSKDYYPFMRRYNITYLQLKILRLLQEKNISKIRYLERYSSYGDSISDLEEITEYISLNRFVKYAKKHRGKIETYIYKDYLRFAKLLGYDLKNNRYAFPKNLREAHDTLEQQYEIQEEDILKKAIIKRGKELSLNKYQDKKFIILPASSLKSMQDESKMQHNCVRTYAEKYAAGNCDIYFMRDIAKKKESLVTVEVRHNRVVQSRIKYNNSPTENQLEFLKKWENNVLKGAA